MFDAAFTGLALRPRSLFESYMDAVASNPAYFTDVTFPDSSGRQNETVANFLGLAVESLPVDHVVLDYLTRVAGLTRREIRLAGWASYSDFHGRHLLLAPARRTAGVIGVRALRIQAGGFGLGDSRFSYDLSDPLFEPNPDVPLAVPDAPVPFSRGVFNASSVWVSHDPIDALVLRSLGINATSLARPLETLASKEGLWQLQDIGAIAPRPRPKGTIVIVDDVQQITRKQAGFLKGQFETVWVSKDGSLAQVMWDIAREAHASNWYNRGSLGLLTDALSGMQGIIPLDADPEPLPLRDAWGGTSTDSRPPAFVPVGELSEPGQSSVEWLVEGFIASGTITQFLGAPKAGKSTLLLSMLAEVSRGGTFLGKKCRKSPVLYVTEQTTGSFHQSLKRSLPDGTSADDLPGLLALTAERFHGQDWTNVLTLVQSTAQQTGARIVVFDTLSEVAGVHGDGENSAGAIRRLYNSMRPLLRDQMAVVAVRHTRKNNQGGIAESGLGSVASAGSADHLVRVREVKARPAVRRIDTLGRLSDAEDFLLELTPSGWARVNSGTPALDRDAPGTDIRGLVVAALREAGERGLRHKELTEALKVSMAGTGRGAVGRSVLDPLLQYLVDEGHASRERLTERGRPALFRFVSAPTPSGVVSERKEKTEWQNGGKR